MPAAIPVIASVAATAALPAGFTIGALSVATSAAIVGGAASLAASFAVSTLNKAKPPDLSAQLTQVGAGRATQIRQPISPHQYHYGQVKTSGPILFVHSQEDGSDRTFGNLYLVHGLSGGKVKAIRTVYFGGQLATLPKFQLTGSQIRIGKHLGTTDQAADADFVAEIADASIWGANHRLRGRAYIATRLTWDAENLPQLENISAIVDGIDTIYDPRTGATGFTNNAALCISNWITSPYGEARAWSKIHEPTLIEAANVCDERMLVLSGSATFSAVESETPGTYTGGLSLSAGARFLDWGDGVRLSTSGSLPAGFSAGTTYYVIPGIDGQIGLATTVAGAFAGTAIVPTTAGSGTHTLTYYDEARYKCNGTFTLDMQKGDVLDQLRSSMAGYAFPRGGKWFIHAGAAAVPTVTLDDDDLRAHPVVVPKRSIRDRYNGVRGVFVNPDANWQPTDAPPRIDAAYVAEDADEELVTDLRSNFIISERQMQRVMKIDLERNRRQGESQVPCKLTAFKLAPLDGVLLTLDGFFDAQQHRVTGWSLNEDLGVDIKAQIDDADIYAWTTADELVGTDFQGVVLPNPSEIAAPAALTITTPTTPTFSELSATWTPVLNIWRDGYDFEYRVSGDTDWDSIGRISQTHDSDVTNVMLLTSMATDVRVRAVARNGTPSAFIENLAPGAPDSPEATDTTIAWDNDPDAASVQVFTSDTDDAATSTLFTTVTPASTESVTVDDDAYYWLRSVNAAGNISGLTDTIVVGTPGGGGE